MRRCSLLALVAALLSGLPPPPARADPVCLTVETWGSEVPEETVEHCEPTPFPVLCRGTQVEHAPQAYVRLTVCAPRSQGGQ